MVKAIAYSICAVLLITSITQAAVGPQTEIWNIGLTNGAAMTSGQGTANAAQGLGTLNIQGDTNGEGTQAWQGVGALVGQNAAVTAIGAPVSVNQDVSIAGDALIIGLGSVPLGQTQTIGDYAAESTQYEGVSIGATQSLVKDGGGLGTATGGNGVGLVMAQVGGDAVGTTLGQGTLVVGGQQGAINGTSPASAGVVSSAMTAIIIQDQAVNATQ